ncbi:MAG TPA: STY0301 family protein [Acetobacteraceae bacterium]|nr:STY0301 family protein [Acetobacteraceae bacterium]
MRPVLLLAALLLPDVSLAQAPNRPPARAPAGQPSFACPPQVQVTPEARIQAPEGWRALPEPQWHFLRGAELFDGDPSERAQLREDSREGAARQRWWDLDPANSRGYHLVCRYEGLEAGITARVPAGLRRCTVETYRDNSRGVRHGRVVMGPDNWVRVTCR